MPGLAFPANGTLTPDIPDSTVFPATPLDDIPIDPALSETPVDAVLLSETTPSLSPHVCTTLVSLRFLETRLSRLVHYFLT